MSKHKLYGPHERRAKRPPDASPAALRRGGVGSGSSATEESGGSGAVA